jgi:hypothetical protein
MTDKEVLQKAIEIATENGYKEPFVFGMGSDFSLDKFQLFKLYFSHDFAKAFWLEDNRLPILKRPYTPNFNRDFEYHLMMMVLEPNPIDYLRKFIKSDAQIHGEKMEDECIKMFNKGESKIIGQRNYKQDGSFEDKFVDTTENSPRERCPYCGSEEIEANTPRTVYGCGSSDYDQRPNTFKQGDNCKRITPKK